MQYTPATRPFTLSSPERSQQREHSLYVVRVLAFSGTSIPSYLYSSLFTPGTYTMSNANWKPFIFGGLASVTAECGELEKKKDVG